MNWHEANHQPVLLFSADDQHFHQPPVDPGALLSNNGSNTIRTSGYLFQAWDTYLESNVREEMIR